MTIRNFIAAAVLTAGLGIAASAQAFPVSAGQGAPSAQEGLSPNIELAAMGCGPGWIRGRFGHCHPMGMGRPVFRPCPPGMHLGPHGHRCFPNRRWRRW